MSNKKPRVIPNTPQDTFRQENGQTKTARRGTPLHAKLTASAAWPLKTSAKKVAAKIGASKGENPEAALEAINGVGKVTAKKLYDAGYETIQDIADGSPTGITNSTGIGDIDALNIFEAAVELVNGEE